VTVCDTSTVSRPRRSTLVTTSVTLDPFNSAARTAERSWRPAGRSQRNAAAGVFVKEHFWGAKSAALSRDAARGRQRRADGFGLRLAGESCLAVDTRP